MIQYFKRRLELLGFWIFSELYLPDSGFGISSFCKSVCGFTAVWSLNRQKMQKKEKKKRNSEHLKKVICK